MLFSVILQLVTIVFDVSLTSCTNPDSNFIWKCQLIEVLYCR